MNTKAFLHDWKPGDTLKASQLNALVQSIAMSETVEPGGGAAPVAKPQRVQVPEGPVEWPWQVFVRPSDDGVMLCYVPGSVLVGEYMTESGEDGQQQLEYQYLSTPAGDYMVQDFAGSIMDPVTVYLELTGEVQAATRLEESDVPGYVPDELQEVQLVRPSLRVTCQPAGDALRVWPLAVYAGWMRQPVTQLQWGDLSALECTAVLSADGIPLWPAPVAGGEDAPAWGEGGYGADMVELYKSGDVSLRGCIDDTGALEMYLGPWTDAPDDQPKPSWDDEDEDEGTEDEDPPPGPYVPVIPPGPNPAPPPNPTRVRYGYEGGWGFISCTLVRAGDGELYWELVLDPDYLAQACAPLGAAAAVTLEADGSTPGTYAIIEMGLGSCTASCAGMVATGGAELLFRGTNNVDVSRKMATVTVTYEGTPTWQQAQTWYLTPRRLHHAGSFVRRVRSGDADSPWVNAYQWYTFVVDDAAFRRSALAYFKAQLGKIQLAASMTSYSHEAAVDAVLHGSALTPAITMTLRPNEQ